VEGEVTITREFSSVLLVRGLSYLPQSTRTIKPATRIDR
jgi:hypothetical protein